MLRIGAIAMVTWCWMAIALVGLERLCELYISQRNARWSAARGGLEFGQDHLSAMKLLHAAFLVGIVTETTINGSTYMPIWTPIFIAGALSAQALRYWCIMTLSHRWNIRVIVIPNLPPVTRGPYGYLAHPNYVAVVLEGVMLPLVFGAWRTALAFSLLNAALLRRRIACESRAIVEVCGPYLPSEANSKERAA